jgi:FkbM family methyltransferase
MNENKRHAWRSSLFSEIDFYSGNWRQKRAGNDFPWSLVYTRSKPIPQTLRSLGRNIRESLGLRKTHSTEWLTSNADALYEARCLFHDDLSKTIFDNTLLLRTVGFEKYFFKKPDFIRLVEVVEHSEFKKDGFPGNYLESPLGSTTFRLAKPVGSGQERLLVAPRFFFEMLNEFQQYFIMRNSVSITPNFGNVVYDCGACIGDMSLVFADIVGPNGEVHTFDPIPLHNLFIRLQAQNNPELVDVMKPNEVAVGLQTKHSTGPKQDESAINPGSLTLTGFSTTSLDDYAKNRSRRVDFIKMDIEGAEIDAIHGAENLIREDRPTLAISSYHKPDDLWRIPLLIRSFLPDSKIYFGHHSPTSWESVTYATT